jgi:hypothetical protein
MLDISNAHPMSACMEFALQWLARIAEHDFENAELQIDINGSGKPLAEVFLVSPEFTYRHPSQFQDWRIEFLCADSAGLLFELDVPFVEEKYRPMQARFSADRDGNILKIRFEALVPS